MSARLAAPSVGHSTTWASDFSPGGIIERHALDSSASSRPLLGWVPTAAYHQPRLRGAMIDCLASVDAEFGLRAAFLYGSAMFLPLDSCSDIDVVCIVASSSLGVTHCTYRSPLCSRPLSITLMALTALVEDFRNLAWAGYLVNKFINPVIALKAPHLVKVWQQDAISVIAAGLSSGSSDSLLLWKDDQFPGWRASHDPSASLQWPRVQPARMLGPWRGPAQDRGHWDVFRSIHALGLELPSHRLAPRAFRVERHTLDSLTYHTMSGDLQALVETPLKAQSRKEGHAGRATIHYLSTLRST